MASAQQLSPSGYTGAINTPTALIQPLGSASGAFTNSQPEVNAGPPRIWRQAGFNLGLGVLPNVELVGRLAFLNDTECNEYRVCRTPSNRDLSVGGKVAVPLEWAWSRHHFVQPHLAFGVTDYGGAATNFRQLYGVASIEAGPVLLSAGKSSAVARGYRGGLMSGYFGSGIWRFDNGLSLLAEYDTREYRAGVSYNRAISADLDLNLAMSRKLSDRTLQKSWQSTLGLTYHFGRGARADAQTVTRLSALVPVAIPSPPPPASMPSRETPQPAPHKGLGAASGQVPPLAAKPAQPPVDIRAQSSSAATPTTPAHARRQSGTALPALAHRAQDIADAFHQAGFSDISVAQSADGWIVKAEPRLWRQSRMDAFGAGLAAWSQARVSDEAQLVLMLTHAGQTVGAVQTTGLCGARYIEGADTCQGEPALRFYFDRETDGFDRSAQWQVRGAYSSRFWPQIELSPAASYTAGTEFGLFDYSLGMTYGWEIPLAKGLQWQGFFSKLLTETEDFKNPSHYFRRVGLGESTGKGANLLVYQHPIMTRLWGQYAVGRLGQETTGQQINAYWASTGGGLRATWIYGEWKNPATHDRHINIWNIGVRPFMPNWQITLSGGQFFNNDRGWRIASSHQFDDFGLNFYLRRTGPSNIMPNQRTFMGFSLSFPLGPKQALALGPMSVRLRDRWSLGLETKIQERDNYIEPGYGGFPVIRHNLDTDIFDFNRFDRGIMGQTMYKIRNTARDVLRSWQTAP